MFIDGSNWQLAPSQRAAVVPPTTQPLAPPYVCLQINIGWLQTCIGALTQLAQAKYWDTATQGELAGVLAAVQSLIDLFQCTTSNPAEWTPLGVWALPLRRFYTPGADVPPQPFGLWGLALDRWAPIPGTPAPQFLGYWTLPLRYGAGASAYSSCSC